jgi:hypothetical protein
VRADGDQPRAIPLKAQRKTELSVTTFCTFLREFSSVRWSGDFRVGDLGS